MRNFGCVTIHISCLFKSRKHFTQRIGDLMRQRRSCTHASGDGFYSRMLYEASLYGMIVLSYTDIKDKITDFDKVSLVDLYDYMDQSGLVQKVIHTIHEMNPKEIDTFIAYASKMFDDAREDGNSASSAVQVVGKAILSSLDTLTKSMKEYSDKLLDTEEKDDEPANLDFNDVTPNKMN